MEAKIRGKRVERILDWIRLRRNPALVYGALPQVRTPGRRDHAFRRLGVGKQVSVDGDGRICRRHRADSRAGAAEGSQRRLRSPLWAAISNSDGQGTAKRERSFRAELPS